ncbi:MAG: beta-hydroxyacyl-ACP dehydratase [Planctomycetaceae bacterium]|jgi:3-hydroxyacyl-[acyl-carrier-protein] dehydratase|nr:beta-hydroxyacyl-ACP dehydratase [Planctomycetaceae bacterium]
MHWYWIDRITVFESQKRAEAVKAVTLAEDHLHDHFKYVPLMPGSLIIEGFAQTAGLLLYEAKEYKEKVVLAKIPKFTFHRVDVVPGEVLTYKVYLETFREAGGVASVRAYRGEELLAEGELMFAHLGLAFSDQPLFADGDMLDMMRLFRVFEVGIAADGTKLLDPKSLEYQKYVKHQRVGS